jgi:formylglycine-generating enzyme required for sulfatase activity
LELRRLYGGVVENCEELPEASYEYVPPKPVIPKPPPAATPAPRLAGWPFDAAEARSRQAAGVPATSRTIDLGDGVKMELVRVPAGRFVMGDVEGLPDEQPAGVVEIDRPFWMGRFEVSNEQFRKFDSSHDCRFEHRSSWIFSEAYLGWPLNQPRQPVVRVSWKEAIAFCRWLSDRLGENVNLPTEAQWEYACRAGAASALSYGTLDADFSTWGNLGDKNLRRLASEGWRPKSPDLVAKDTRFDDGMLVTAEIGRYQPNPWGLHDMHGNAAEWTRSTFRPYPVKPDDGRDAVTMEGEKVVRGGSWRDRPQRCRSAFRLSYPAWQKVFNVGFRVIIEPGDKALASTAVPPN